MVTICFPYVVLNGTSIDSVRASWIVGWVMPLAAEAKSLGEKGVFPHRKVSGYQPKEGFCLWGTPKTASAAHKLLLGIAGYPFGILHCCCRRNDGGQRQEQPVLTPLRGFASRH